MNEVEVLKEVKVWNFQNWQGGAVFPLLPKDDFKYNDIIGFDEYDQPLSCILEEDSDTTTYVIWETYTLDVSLWS